VADEIRFSDFTAGEKARVAMLTARMAKRGMAGPGVDISDLQRAVERIERQAAKRKNGK
jgi:2-methylcitrate dehydratase PrpD